MSKNEESTETKEKKNTLLPVEFLHVNIKIKNTYFYKFN